MVTSGTHARNQRFPIQLWLGGAPSPTRRIASRIGWGAVLLVAIYYIYTEAVPYFQSRSDQRSGARTTEILPILLVHISAGTVALLLGPTQFWSAMRTHYRVVHRWIGRTYLVAVLIGAAASMYITAMYPHRAGPVFQSGLAGLAIVWFTTSLMAYLAIRQRNIQEHREWMIRSYTVTFGFVVFRMVAEALGGTGMELQEWAGISAWLCWAGPLFAVEVALSIHRQRSSGARRPRIRGRIPERPASVGLAALE